MSARRSVTVLTHQRPEQTAPVLETLRLEARRHGAVLCFDPEETRKHGLHAAEGIEVDAEPAPEVELCVVLGGDGTILRGLRQYAGTGVPVFAVNFGEVGFLATGGARRGRAGFARRSPRTSRS
jgi:NAD+ kinase